MFPRRQWAALRECSAPECFAVSNDDDNALENLSPFSHLCLNGRLSNALDYKPSSYMLPQWSEAKTNVTKSEIPLTFPHFPTSSRQTLSASLHTPRAGSPLTADDGTVVKKTMTKNLNVADESFYFKVR